MLIHNSGSDVGWLSGLAGIAVALYSGPGRTKFARRGNDYGSSICAFAVKPSPTLGHRRQNC
jgi:hypothetical protein